MNNKIIREIKSWILVLVIGVLLAFVINKLVMFKVVVPTASMEKTIMVDDRVITFRLAYLFQNPKRGDIVVFPFPDNEKEDYIKRIIGLPGETIEGKDGHVYLDGVKLEETYVADKLAEDFGPFEIPEDSYFMMGDNRVGSFDSREWDNKFVHKDKILGKAVLKYPDFQWFD